MKLFLFIIFEVLRLGLGDLVADGHGNTLATKNVKESKGISTLYETNLRRTSDAILSTDNANPSSEYVKTKSLLKKSDVQKYDQIQKIDNEELIQKSRTIFQEIKNSELLIDGAYNSFNTWQMMIDENEFAQVSGMKSKFSSFKNDLRKQFGDQVVLFRGDKINRQALIGLIKTYENSNFTSDKVISFLNDFLKTTKKIQLLELFRSSKASFIDGKTTKYKILAEKYHETVKIISADLGIEISSRNVQDIIRLLKTECVSVSCYIEDVVISVPEITEYLEGNVMNTFPVDKKEYFLISTQEGLAIIIDANSYEQIISYKTPEIGTTIGAIVNSTYYSIDSGLGVIKSISVENIMTQDLTDWAYVGYFPNETHSPYYSAVVNGTSLYFITPTGILYSYDVVHKTVTKWGTVTGGCCRTGLVIVDNILYIFKSTSFYSFDGSTIKSITPPTERAWSDLFEMEKTVCAVGGSTTNADPDPVSCYDPVEKSWTVSSYINEGRKYEGVARSQSGVHIFGGQSYTSGNLTDSAEVFNTETKKWSFIPSPFYNVQHDVSYTHTQAITFYF